MTAIMKYLRPLIYVLGGVIIAMTIQLSMTGDGVRWRWGKIGFGPIADVIDVFSNGFEVPVSSVLTSETSNGWFGKSN